MARCTGSLGVLYPAKLRNTSRRLSRRYRRARSGAAAKIAKRINAGEQVRQDEFFNDNPSGRSEGEEVWESILMKSQREPEEKKLPYMAHLLANLAFDPGIGSHMAHQVTKTAEQLTYRQLCILKLIMVKEQYALRENDYRKAGGAFPAELY